jgi:hypothetical protein
MNKNSTKTAYLLSLPLAPLCQAEGGGGDLNKNKIGGLMNKIKKNWRI